MKVSTTQFLVAAAFLAQMAVARPMNPAQCRPRATATSPANTASSPAGNYGAASPANGYDAASPAATAGGAAAPADGVYGICTDCQPIPNAVSPYGGETKVVALSNYGQRPVPKPVGQPIAALTCGQCQSMTISIQINNIPLLPSRGTVIPAPKQNATSPAQTEKTATAGRNGGIVPACQFGNVIAVSGPLGGGIAPASPAAAAAKDQAQSAAGPKVIIDFSRQESTKKTENTLVAANVEKSQFGGSCLSIQAKGKLVQPIVADRTAQNMNNKVIVVTASNVKKSAYIAACSNGQCTTTSTKAVNSTETRTETTAAGADGLFVPLSLPSVPIPIGVAAKPAQAVDVAQPSTYVIPCSMFKFKEMKAVEFGGEWNVHTVQYMEQTEVSKFIYQQDGSIPVIAGSTTTTTKEESSTTTQTVRA